MAALNVLPNELLSLIASHLDRPRDLLHLSLADRRLSQFAKLDGWKAFLKGRFGLNGLDSDARNTVHGLTTLYRNWKRKGFVARYLEPSDKLVSLSNWGAQTWRRPQGQTMGYRPSIDSYEEILGAWSDRREVLAWSAGTQIVLRIKEAGDDIEKIRLKDSGLNHDPKRTWSYDVFHHLNSWFTYKIPNSLEGRDDITCLKLLRPEQRDLAYEDLVFGTASGQLSRLSVSPDQEKTYTRQFDTGNAAVSSLSISGASNPMLVASLGDSILSLYPLHHRGPPGNMTAEISRVRLETSGIWDGRIWSCQFIADDQVAVGVGPCANPVQVCKITPTGFLPEPIRTFKLQPKIDRITSVFPILPIQAGSNAGSGSSSTFLSGGFDGLIRIHDLRSPRDYEMIFWDPTNDSTIYSLAAQGLERVIAGVSMHNMIKVFDMRFSGSHTYNTIPTSPKPALDAIGADRALNRLINKVGSSAPTISGGWNLYLRPRQPPKRHAYRGDYWRTQEDSPVYSLSVPSPTSQNVYAGLEGVVQSLTFHGIADPYPDTTLSHSIVRSPNDGAIDVKASYDPHGSALDLGMYEQGSEEDLGMQLLVQNDVAASGKYSNSTVNSSASSLDERWKDIRDEGDRWKRGEALPAPRRGRGRGRGGRGRARG
ncbi:hypothetical protein ACN47E_000063 [Coniothyrium glycines]